MTEEPTPEQIAAEAFERFPELDPAYASLTYPAEAMRSHNRTAFESGARWAALVAAAGAAPQPEGLTERIADTLAYYQCRETNPKADHPRMGYHAFPEEHRAHLREQKAEAAAEIVRMMAAGAAPQEPTPAPSKYINPSLPGMIRNLWKSDPSEASVRTALGLAGDLIQELIDLRAAPVQVDEAKLAEVLVRALTYGTGLDAETNNAIAATQASDAAEYLRGGGQ